MAIKYIESISAWGKTSSPNEFPGYDIKLSDGEAPVMLKLWGMQRTPLLTSLSSQL